MLLPEILELAVGVANYSWRGGAGAGRFGAAVKCVSLTATTAEGYLDAHCESFADGPLWFQEIRGEKGSTLALSMPWVPAFEAGKMRALVVETQICQTMTNTEAGMYFIKLSWRVVVFF